MECPICGSYMKLEEIKTYYGTDSYEWVCSNENCKSNIDELK